MLEVTTLPIDLYGTIAGEEGRGYAVIEERTRKGSASTGSATGSPGP